MSAKFQCKEVKEIQISKERNGFVSRMALLKIYHDTYRM